MAMKMLCELAILAVLLPGAASAQNAPAGDAEISYTSLDGLFREFTADRNGDGVYLRDRGNNWYFARFEQRCDALLETAVVGFKTDANHRIASGTIVVVPKAGGHAECRIARFAHSDAPPSALRNRVIPRQTAWAGGVYFPGAVPVGDMSARPSSRTTLH
jgi:hypothetical protein